VLAHPGVELGPEHFARFTDGIARREKGEPIAYIRGIKEFFGYVFVVDSRVLIPRPETELIVEMGLARIQGALTGAPRPPGTPPVLVADVGTGSGAIAISLALQSRRRGYDREVRFVAADVDAAALGLALENGVAHAVADIVDFVLADLVPESDRPFDLILANLPYIPTADLAGLPVAASFEPRNALDGGPDGLAITRRLLGELPDRLAQRGEALIEIGAHQADRVAAEGDSLLPGWSISTHRDLSGQARVIEVARPAAGPA